MKFTSVSSRLNECCVSNSSLSNTLVAGKAVEKVNRMLRIDGEEHHHVAQNPIETLDLDAIFGESATDLEAEYKKIAITTAGSDPNSNERPWRGARVGDIQMTTSRLCYRNK